jgi:hypothetical protein
MKIHIPNEHLYAKLLKAIDEAPSIPPCQVTDPEIWYSEHGETGNGYRVAKKLCGQCPVVMQCAAYAIEADEIEGCWGGLSPRERQKMRSARKLIRTNGRPRKTVQNV